MRRRVSPLEGPPSEVDDDAAVLRLLDGGAALLDRVAGTATYQLPRAMDDDELAHPYLAVAATWFARWHGRQALHAGAFVADGRAWGVLGGREQGKSTTLAQLHLSGFPILAEDVLIVDGTTGLAGPRCIDLRDGTVAQLRAERNVVASRSGTRRRLLLPPVELEVPVCGWIFLAWGDAIEVQPMPPAERLGRLNEQRIGAWEGEDPAGVLDLATLPAWTFRRPRTWSSLASSTDRLLAAVVGS